MPAAVCLALAFAVLGPAPAAKAQTDSPDATISRSHSSVNEGTAASFTVTLSTAAPTGGVTVTYDVSLEEPNPVAGKAHVAPANLGNKSVTVAAGATSATVRVATVDQDELVSEDSTLKLTLATGTGYTLGTASSASVTITDTTTTNLTFAEGCTWGRVKESRDVAAVEVLSDTDVAFNFSLLMLTVPGTAGAGTEYVEASANRAIVFPALTRSATLNVQLIDDEKVEGDESFDTWMLRNGLDPQLLTNTGCASNATTVTIEDDDYGDYVASAPRRVSEGDPITVTVGLDGLQDHGSCIIPRPVHVTLAVGGATSALSGNTADDRIRIAPCTNKVTRQFTTREDTTRNADRTVTFTLSKFEGDTWGGRVGLGPQPSVTVTIVDDDQPGLVLTDADALETTEAGGTATFKVALRAPPTANVTVTPHVTALGEARMSGALTFTTANWNVAQSVTATGLDDDERDGDAPYDIHFRLTSADAGYNGLFVDPAKAVNRDDERNATGVPTVWGGVRPGTSVRAQTSAIADPDGLTAPKLRYQWVRVRHGVNFTRIPGATAATYTLSEADVGAHLVVRVGFTDDAGGSELRRSAPYPRERHGILPAAPCPAPAHPTEGGAVKRLDATMTVGPLFSLAGEDDWGYSRGSANEGHSAITQREFVANGHTQIIRQIYTDRDSGRSGTAEFVVTIQRKGGGASTPETLADATRTTLYVCDRAFRAVDAELSVSGAFRKWTTDLDLYTLRYATRRVRIYEDRTPPSVVSAEATGRTLTLAFSERVDPRSVPPAGAFTVWKQGASDTEATRVALAEGTPLSLGGRGLSLALAAAPAAGDTVTVDYTPPDTGKVRDLTHNELAAFASRAVTVSAPPASCPSPALTGRETLWQATLGVGLHTVGNAKRWGFGYFPAHGVGTLATSAFRPSGRGGTAQATHVFLYDVEEADRAALSRIEGAAHGDFLLILDRPLTRAEHADLELHACNKTLAFSAAAHTDYSSKAPDGTVTLGRQHYRWTNPGLSWQDGQTVELRITQAGPTRIAGQTTAPAITGQPGVSAAGDDGQWTSGETVEVTLTFDEAVAVDTAGGTPSVGLSLGGSASRSAPYVRGTGTTALVFAYTLADADGAHASMTVPFDSLALNGGTIRSVASGADASLSHVGASVLGQSSGTAIGDRGQVGKPDGFTARFERLPERHDGETAFTVELHFSAAPDALSYRTVGGGLLEVSGANVTGARRLTRGSNLGWEVTVEPTRGGDITMRLPARACTEANAVCAGGAPLARAATATVPGVPFTASFSEVPTEHDGKSEIELRFHFSEAPGGLSYKTVRDNLFEVSGARIEKASRVEPGKNVKWRLRIAPSGFGDVTLRLKPTTDCAAGHAVCTADGRMLAGGVTATVAGPVTLSVADAQVDEAGDATLDFVVSLSRARTSATTVRYATSDGTASAGADYTSTTGTLTFAAGETSKTVSVPVLDDAHDEGHETLTLTLSNVSPSRVKLAEARATGTIKNTDPLQRAWLARFGRTVGTHVTDAVGERLRGTPGQDSYLTIGGYRVPLGRQGARAGGPTGEPGADAPGLLSFPTPIGNPVSVTGKDKSQDAEAERALAAKLWGPLTPAEPAEPPGRLATLVRDVAQMVGVGLSGQAGAPASATGAAASAPIGWDPWLDGPATDPRLGQSQSLQLPDLRQVLLGSAFRLNLNAADAGTSTPHLTAWGRFAGTRFDGRDGDLTLDGDVFTGTVGVDGEWDRLLAGVAVAHSRGDGTFLMPGTAERGQGELEQTLTSLHPYLRYAVTDRLDVWGLLGYGWGDLDLEMANGTTTETDTQLMMGAFGGRGVLLTPEDSGGFQLATRTDAMLTRTSADAVANSAATDADAHRLRVILEGSRGVTWADGRQLTPTVELGLRHDWGDAETGFGLEVGGRVQYADPSLGLTIEAAVRGLVAHEDEDYQEWGASGTMRLAPVAGSQGLALTVSPTWGVAASGVEGLWSRQTTAGLAPQSRPPAQSGRLAAEVGYGLPAPVGPGLLTPYVGTVLTDGADRTYRVGTRLQMPGLGATGLTLSLEGTRQEPTGQQPVNQGVRLQAEWGF